MNKKTIHIYLKPHFQIPKIKKGLCFYDKEYKYHIISVLALEKNAQIVYKYYGKHKQWWHYEIMSFKTFIFRLQHEMYFLNRR